MGERAKAISLNNWAAPGLLIASFAFPPTTTPTWHSSDDSVVSISSVTADGMMAIPILGRPGVATVVAQAYASFRRVICEVDVYILGTDGGQGTIQWQDNGPL